MADALDSESVGRTFDTIIDSGCFHTLSDDDRVRYAASMRALSEPDGRLVVMCFSDASPLAGGRGA